MDSRFFERIQHLMSVKRHQMALDELNKQLIDYPDLELLHYFVAACHFAMDQYVDATRAIERAIQLEPEDEDNHILRSQIMLLRNHHAEAAASAETAVSLNSEHASAHLVLAQAKQHQKKYADALRAVDASLSIDPTDEIALATRAQILRALGRHDEAADTTQSLLREAPDDDMAMFTKAETLFVEGEFEESLKYYREALRMDPQFTAARDGAVRVMLTRYRLMRFVTNVLLWLYKLSPAVRNSLIIACLVVIFYRPSDPQLQAIWIPLRLLVVSFSMLLMLANPLMTAAMSLTREGRDVLPTSTKTAAIWTASAVVTTVGVAAAHYALHLNGFYTAVIYGVSAIFASIEIDDAHPSWPRKTLVALTLASMFFAVTALATANVVDDETINQMINSSVKPDLSLVQQLSLLAFTLLYKIRLYWLILVGLAYMFLDEVVVKE